MKEVKQMLEFNGLEPQLIQIMVGGVIIKEYFPEFADEVDLTLSITERKLSAAERAESTI